MKNRKTEGTKEWEIIEYICEDIEMGDRENIHQALRSVQSE